MSKINNMQIRFIPISLSPRCLRNLEGGWVWREDTGGNIVREDNRTVPKKNKCPTPDGTSVCCKGPTNRYFPLISLKIFYLNH